MIETPLEGNPSTSFFGVFDGHGGSYTACYTAENLMSELKAQEDYHGRETTPEQYESVLKKGFVSFDGKLRSIVQDISGSTAITAFVTPTHIICGNLGDSRCLLSRNWEPIPLSSDHKPEKTVERNRIIHAGGTVIAGRVNDLAVSRAFGDFSYKLNADLGPDQQLVSCMPDVKIVQRDEKDNFLILACDGIWDVMPSPAQAIELLRELFESYEDPKEAVEEFVETCLQEGSKDNMTIMVVFLNDPPKPVPSKVEQKVKSKQEEFPSEL